jgi:aminoglycoside phosphotransferase family enzyme
MRSPGIDEKVAFLSRAEVYPDDTQHVVAKRTHMSWVFLTDAHAWKLKRPVRSEYLDFSTPEARRRDCEREVQLNRRLAPDVYQGVVALTADRHGDLQLNGKGRPVDWLVCMRRLPSHRMLDQVIARRRVSKEVVFQLGSVLAAFYRTAPPVPITRLQYRKRLAGDLQAAQTELVIADYGLPRGLAESVICPRLEFLLQNPLVFDQRVDAGRIIEGHGDLRPEHICLERPPVIIDCLEFNRDLRILDAASELEFLALECERLGAPQIGQWIFDRYVQETGDQPSDRLRDFYKTYHACIRAKLSLWHLKDSGIADRAIWTAKAERYLEIVRRSYAAA